MKIKGDFITNSSSTSFLLAFKNDYSHKKLIAASGIKENSILAEIFEDFFCSLSYEPLEITELNRYDSEIYKEKIENLEKKGMKVYIGSFSSDNGLIESFFCQDAFLIEDEEIYFDGSVDIW